VKQLDYRLLTGSRAFRLSHPEIVQTEHPVITAGPGAAPVLAADQEEAAVSAAVPVVVSEGAVAEDGNRVACLVYSSGISEALISLTTT
jgi:hypothetical protein